MEPHSDHQTDTQANATAAAGRFADTDSVRGYPAGNQRRERADSGGVQERGAGGLSFTVQGQQVQATAATAGQGQEPFRSQRKPFPSLMLSEGLRFYVRRSSQGLSNFCNVLRAVGESEHYQVKPYFGIRNGGSSAPGFVLPD